jgi:hypothetical protein
MELRCHPCLQILHRIRRRVERDSSPYSVLALAPIDGDLLPMHHKEKVLAGVAA